MQKNKKNSKIDKIKQQAKIYGPAALIFAATATATILTGRAIIKQTNQLLEDGSDSGSNLLPVIEGDEKEALLERPDSVLQFIETDLYFLSFPEKTETEA